MAENHDVRSRRQSVIFEEPPAGGFSRAIWLEYANQQTFKGDESGEFPHEVGLFLSYPPEDVKGFIAHRANDFKCAGLWKVYGNEEKARSLFAKIQKMHGDLLRTLAKRLEAGTACRCSLII